MHTAVIGVEIQVPYQEALDDCMALWVPKVQVRTCRRVVNRYVSPHWIYPPKPRPGLFGRDHEETKCLVYSIMKVDWEICQVWPDVTLHT